MKKFLLIVTLFSVICNGCYELDFDTDFHSGIYEKRYSRIYYTTSDNRPIELDTSLENRVVSNTYSNGQGVLVFEDIVTEIESETFYSCKNLTSLKIPDSVTKIGNFAFTGCNRLEKIYIPNSVTTIGDSAFKYCSSLTSVYISDLSAWCRISFENYPSNPLSNGANLYLNNKLVTYLVIPSDITEIKSYAFCKCSCLTSITIPDSVTTIGKYAFEGCSSLTSVYCKATTPPTGGFYMFDDNASGREIYVPTGSVKAYKSASYWSNYASYIVGYNF